MGVAEFFCGLVGSYYKTRATCDLQPYFSSISFTQWSKLTKSFIYGKNKTFKFFMSACFVHYTEMIR